MSADAVVLERRLSTERLRPYRSVVSGDLTAAIRLYVWNSQISSALAETIGHVEILVRNALHERLTAWSSATYNEPVWYRDPGRILHVERTHDVRKARLNAVREGATETPGRVVAELNFGFWRFMTSATYDRTLWRNCLHLAFPGRPRAAAQARLVEVNLARNRCAHHEPMHNRPLSRLHDDVLELAGWVCPVTAVWIADLSRVTDVLRRRP